MWRAVRRGIDMFDCVMPTRNARNGFLFTAEGTLRIRNAKFAMETRVIEEGCDCWALAPTASPGPTCVIWTAATRSSAASWPRCTTCATTSG